MAQNQFVVGSLYTYYFTTPRKVNFDVIRQHKV